MKDFLKKSIEQNDQSIVIFSNHIANKLIEPKVVYVNDSFLKKCNISHDVIFNKNPFLFLRNGNQTEKYISIIEETITQNKIWSGILDFYFNGTENSFFSEIVPISNCENKIIYYACFLDSTEKQKNHLSNHSSTNKHLDLFVDSLLEKSNVFKDFVDQIPVGLWRASLDGEINYLNQTMIDYFGIKENNNIFDIFGNNFALHDFDSLEKKKIVFQCGDFWIKCKFWAVGDDVEILGLCGAFYDVTEDYSIINQIQKIKQEV